MDPSQHADADHDPRRAGSDLLRVPVGPVVPDRRLPTLPRSAMVGLIAGAIGLVAGLAIGGAAPSGGLAAATPTSPSPTATNVEAPTQSSPPSLPTATPDRVQPGLTNVAEAFAPIEIVKAVPRGTKCEGVDLGTTTASGRNGVDELAFAHTWAIVCPVPAAAGEEFASGVIQRVIAAVGADSAAASSNEAGTMVMLVPYVAQGVGGAVTIAMKPAASNKSIELMVTLEEHTDP